MTERIEWTVDFGARISKETLERREWPESMSVHYNIAVDQLQHVESIKENLNKVILNIAEWAIASEVAFDEFRVNFYNVINGGNL